MGRFAAKLSTGRMVRLNRPLPPSSARQVRDVCRAPLRATSVGRPRPKSGARGRCRRVGVERSRRSPARVSGAARCAAPRPAFCPRPRGVVGRRPRLGGGISGARPLPYAATRRGFGVWGRACVAGLAIARTLAPLRRLAPPPPPSKARAAAGAGSDAPPVAVRSVPSRCCCLAVYICR